MIHVDSNLETCTPNGLFPIKGNEEDILNETINDIYDDDPDLQKYIYRCFEIDPRYPNSTRIDTNDKLSVMAEFNIHIAIVEIPDEVYAEIMKEKESELKMFECINWNKEPIMEELMSKCTKVFEQTYSGLF
jgi:hypothetical protein